MLRFALGVTASMLLAAGASLTAAAKSTTGTLVIRSPGGVHVDGAAPRIVALTRGFASATAEGRVASSRAGSLQSAARPLAGEVIVIDPGHNPGNASHAAQINRAVDFGAGMKPCDTTGTATLDGYTEAAYTLDVAYRVRTLLRGEGATVLLTHTATKPAWGPCITERAAIGNRSNAAAAVSIHADGGPSGGRGFATIIPASPIPAVGLTRAMIAHDQKLAIAVRGAYRSATGMPYSTYLGTRAIYASNAYGGTNLSHVPKIFIETGNMRNRTDAALLESSEFRQRAARGIAAGIANFVGNR